jgi:uncharacterized protein YndB with AHSA1/START domain
LSVSSVDPDYDNLTITLIADFDSPIEQVWELWSNPRKLERWWGPPPYRATVEKHDLTPGGEVMSVMTGPDGDTRGIWRVTAVDPPTLLEFIDSFADTDWTPIADMPVSTVSVRLSERDGGTRMQMQWTFKSRDDMETMLKMGFLEGLQDAVGQMDALVGAEAYDA